MKKESPFASSVNDAEETSSSSSGQPSEGVRNCDVDIYFIFGFLDYFNQIVCAFTRPLRMELPRVLILLLDHKLLVSTALFSSYGSYLSSFN